MGKKTCFFNLFANGFEFLKSQEFFFKFFNQIHAIYFDGYGLAYGAAVCRLDVECQRRVGCIQLYKI